MNLTWLFVGAAYAAAIFLARRAGVDIPRRIAFFFYALTVIFFFSALTGPYVNFPVDILKSLPPWYYLSNDHHQYTPELNDLAMQIVPWMHQVRESWKSFDAPLWNHLSGSGYPLHGNGQASALSLLRILTLPLNLGHAISAEAAFKVLIALTFTFLYCRRRYSLLASTIASVTFGFSGFIIGWLHFPMATAACMAPAVLYCVDLLAERVTFGRFVFTAAMWTQQLFAGHPETSAHLFWLALMYTLWLCFVERTVEKPWRFFLRLGAVMTVAALLSAPYLAPFLETTPLSKRVAELEANPLDPKALPNTDRFSATVMFQAHFFGQVPLEKPWGPSDTEPLAGWPGVFGWTAWLAVALSIPFRRPLGDALRSRETFFVLTTFFVLGVIFAWPGFSEVFHAIMPIAAHARLRLLFVLLAAFQVAAAIDLARRMPLLVATAATAVMLHYVLTFAPKIAYRYDTAVLAMLPSIVVLLAATAAAMTKRRWALMALLAAVTSEMFIVQRDRPTPLHEHAMYPDTPLIARLQELRAQAKDPMRIVGIGPAFFPNLSAIYGLEDIRAHDPMSNARYLAFLKLTADYDPWNYFAWLRDPDKSVYDFLNVRYVVLDPYTSWKDTQRYAVVYEGRDGRILENRNVLPRFFAARNVLLEFRDEVLYPRLRAHTDWANTVYLDDLKVEAEQQRGDFFSPRPAEAPLAEATIVSAKPTDYRIDVKAPRWSLIASSIPWWPGWIVERNGQRVEPIRVNALFLGFAVPAGQSDVRVYYAPWTWWAGVGIALVTLIGIIGVGTYRLHPAGRPSP
jgi:hypothetical protein